jgi:restriction system protein
MLSTFGDFEPYLPAAIFVAVCTALLALYLRRRRGSSPSGDPGTRALHGMKVREFEALVRESFRAQGYKLIDAPRGASEGGELMLRRDRETVLVQCKHWRDRKVGVEVVQSLQHAMAARGAGGGFVLTTGRFGREAVAFAAGCNVRLIDGPALRGLIDKANRAQANIATR